jgi:hypothetical protein
MSGFEAARMYYNEPTATDGQQRDHGKDTETNKSPPGTCSIAAQHASTMFPEIVAEEVQARIDQYVHRNDPEKTSSKEIGVGDAADADVPLTDQEEAEYAARYKRYHGTLPQSMRNSTGSAARFTGNLEQTAKYALTDDGRLVHTTEYDVVRPVQALAQIALNQGVTPAEAMAQYKRGRAIAMGILPKDGDVDSSEGGLKCLAGSPVVARLRQTVQRARQYIVDVWQAWTAREDTVPLAEMPQITEEQAQALLNQLPADKREKEDGL